ncbi:MAG: helix-turn-helix domain-containing protein [Bacteroidota bacterium]
MIRDDRLSRIGKKIKEIRKSRQMSLQEVASKSSVTAGLLSKIENFRTIPSLPVLLSIAKALDVDLSELVSSVMNNDEAPYILVRKGEGEVEEREDSKGLKYQSILSYSISNLTELNIKVNMVSLDIGADRQPIATDALELIHVISGSVKYGLPDHEVELQQGDTLFFNGRLPHSVKNMYFKETVLFKVYLLQN